MAIVASLDFRSERFKIYFICKSPDSFYHFSKFWSTGCPDTSYQVSSQLAFWFRRRSAKQIFNMAAILDFWSERFKLYLICKSPWCFLPCFESISLSVQEKKVKVDFRVGRRCGHLGLPNGTHFCVGRLRKVFLISKLPQGFLSSFESVCLSVRRRAK